MLFFGDLPSRPGSLQKRRRKRWGGRRRGCLSALTSKSLTSTFTQSYTCTYSPMTETVAYAKKFSFSVEAKTETLGNDEQYSSSRWSWFTFEACMNTWALALWASPPPCWGELLKGWSRWPTPDTALSSPSYSPSSLFTIVSPAWPLAGQSRQRLCDFDSFPHHQYHRQVGERPRIFIRRVFPVQNETEVITINHIVHQTRPFYFFHSRQDTVRCWSPSWLKAKFSLMSQIAISWSYRCWSCRSCWQVLIWYRWWRWSHTFVA